MNRRPHELRRDNPWATLVTGSAVLAVGVIFWLDQTDRLDASDVLRWWSVVLIGWGLASLPERRYTSAVILILLGILFLPAVPFLPPLHIGHLLAIWPLFITAAGITLIVQALRPRRDLSRENGFRTIAVMGGNNRRIALERIGGGEAIAIMGGCEIDLTAATLERDAVIDVLAFAGGIGVRVPRGWRIENRVLPLLGAFTDKTEEPITPNAPCLTFRGSAIMGGIEVQNAKEVRL